jgi:four helix bundle protein
MALNHERLDAYQRALDFLELADRVVQDLPQGRAHLGDQLARASTSVVLNIAEGAGRQGPLDKRRFYVMARGSAMESAAILDILARLQLLSPDAHVAGKAVLERIVSMLVVLSKNLERA